MSGASAGAPAPSCGPDQAQCITCGDEGIPMRVVAVEQGSAICVDEDDARHEVAIELVAPVRHGDELLVHAGVAIAVLGGAA